ncbi:MAG TPA: VWA domain-containing protein [Candidatus Dormibacteraeota bacterium]|nr:VWA domain-containing protein [Candidatus Dormibacteraeota bacterium]
MRLRKCVLMLFTMILAIALVLPWNSGAQSNQPPQKASGQGDPQQPIRVEVSLVNLFATVRDHSKKIVPNLSKEEFRIMEDGVEQKIAAFSHEAALPVTLALLIDTSGSEEALLGAEQEAASRFLGRVLRKGDLAMVMSFDLDVDLLADFTDNRSTLDRAIHRAKINTGGGGHQGPIAQRGPIGTNLYDAVYLACHEKLVEEAGRKALVILTDAEDNGSKLRLEEAIEAAQRTDSVIHVLLIGDRWHYGTNPGVANKMANETGGRMIEVSSEKKLEQAFDEISQELRSQYTLGYYPSNRAHDGAFRKVKVETPGKEFKVLTRRGYYAPKN